MLIVLYFKVVMILFFYFLTGSTLEEILAAARNQPDEPGLVEDVDSDETSSDADEDQLEHNSISRKSSHLSQQFEASENLEQSAGVVECDDIDSSSDSSSDADDDGFTFVKKDGEDILSNFPRSASPLVIDTIASENEYKQEAEIEGSENFEKPEVILKSALVNPNSEDNISYPEQDIIDEKQETKDETVFDTEQTIPAENASEFQDKEEQLLVESVEAQVEDQSAFEEDNKEIADTLEEFENSVNVEKEENIEGQIKENPLFINEDISDIKEVTEPEFNTEETFTQSASPLQVSPAVNTLNALEDYMNQDLADAESSSAPSSLESQSGPASVIIESQEVPIPDQASFIIKPTESHQIDLPSPQEAIVEVIPEEHFRERSQSPILEENEDMSDSESKSPVPTPHLNGNTFEAPEIVDNDIVSKDLQVSKDFTPEPIEEKECPVSKAMEIDTDTNVDRASCEKEINVEKIDAVEVTQMKEENKDIEESVVQQDIHETTNQCVNDANLDTDLPESNEDVNILSSNEHVIDQASDENITVVTSPSLPPNDAAAPTQMLDQAETEENVDEVSQKVNVEEVVGETIEVESVNDKIVTPEPSMEEEKLEAKFEGNSAVITEGLSLKCDEIPAEDQNKCDEPPTAEVTEGKVGFYAEMDPPLELKDSELKEDILKQNEVIEETKEEVTQEDTNAGKMTSEKVDSEPIIPEGPIVANVSADKYEEEKDNETQLPQNDESVFLNAPEVNLTPATPIPEVHDEIIDSPLEVEIKVPNEIVSIEPEKAIEPTIVVEAAEQQDTKKAEDKKVLQGKTSASPSPKRTTKPAAAKPMTPTKTTGTSVSSPKPRTKPTATKPSSTPISRVASSSASKQPTSGSTLANKRPASGTASSRSTPVSSTTTARSGVASKPAARTPTPRTATTTPARQPLSTRAPAAKPKTMGPSAAAAGAKSASSLTSRPIASKPPVAKSKVDEPKKTATSSVSSRSTLTRTASPASGSRSRTPVSPKTTAPKTTRSTTSTTSRSTITSTNATSRASTKTATTTTGATATTRKAPTPRTAPVRSTPTTLSSRTTVSRTAAPSTRATPSSTSPAKSKPIGSDMMRRPLVPSGPRPTDLTKKRIPSAKDKQQSNSTKSIPSKTKPAGVATTPEENGVEKSSNDSQIKINGGSSPDVSGQLINGANGDDGNVGSGQNPSTPVNSSGAASPIGEPGQPTLANGVL